MTGKPTEPSESESEGTPPRDQSAPPEAPENGREAETSDEDLFRLFVGPNAEKFLRIYRAQKEKKHATSFNWVVLFASLPWFFYRKLYVVGACILLLPIILIVIFPNLSGVSTTGIAVALALLANSLYVQIAQRRIKKVKALNLPPAERDQRIRKAGGTSPAGAVFGALILVSMVAVFFIDKATARLPDCHNAQVQNLAKTILTGILSENGVDAEALAVSDFKAVESAEDGTRHLCSFSADLESENSTMFLSVTWKDSAAGEFEVIVGPTQDSVSQ